MAGNPCAELYGFDIPSSIILLSKILRQIAASAFTPAPTASCSSSVVAPAGTVVKRK